jgi:hypothetical protein
MAIIYSPRRGDVIVERLLEFVEAVSKVGDSLLFLDE